MGSFTRFTHSPALANPGVSLLFTILSLLLLVLVLLSVPGPIKGLYWFSIEGEQSGQGPMTVGVTGWCSTETSNCTYAPLSDNKYLSSMIDVGQALTVRMMLPLACYWAIITLVAWGALAGTAPLGYRIKDLDSIRRHLYFAVLEACVLCITLFGNVLCWLAFGLGRNAYTTVRSGGGQPKSGQAMETTAVAALMSLFSIFLALWGLHLRLSKAQADWKKEAVMVRRRSMALSASGVPHDGMGNRLSVSMAAGDSATLVGSAMGANEKRWSMQDSLAGGGPGAGFYGAATEPSDRLRRSSSVNKDAMGLEDEEERLDADLEIARRNSRDHAILQRASMLSPHDSPYAIAQAPPAAQR